MRKEGKKSVDIQPNFIQIFYINLLEKVGMKKKEFRLRAEFIILFVFFCKVPGKVQSLRYK